MLKKSLFIGTSNFTECPVFLFAESAALFVISDNYVEFLHK